MDAPRRRSGRDPDADARQRLRRSYRQAREPSRHLVERRARRWWIWVLAALVFACAVIMTILEGPAMGLLVLVVTGGGTVCIVLRTGAVLHHEDDEWEEMRARRARHRPRVPSVTAPASADSPSSPRAIVPPVVRAGRRAPAASRAHDGAVDPRRPWTSQAANRKRQALIAGVVAAILAVGIGAFRLWTLQDRMAYDRERKEQTEREWDALRSNLRQSRTQLERGKALREQARLPNLGRPPTGKQVALASVFLERLSAHHVHVPDLSVAGERGGQAIFAFPVLAEDAISTWEWLCAHAAEIGRYPVIVSWGEFGPLDESKEALEPKVILARAAGINAQAWLRERAQADAEYYGAVEVGSWDEEALPQTDFLTLEDTLSGQPRGDLHVLLIPTTVSWEVCAWLGFGGWNENPPPEVHVAVQKHWQETYGAELACMQGDLLEFRVGNPPASRQGAEALARLQFLYSGGDLVYQGTGSLRALANGLVDSRVWFFWWD